jgi:hypothetical protein
VDLAPSSRCLHHAPAAGGSTRADVPDDTLSADSGRAGAGHDGEADPGQADGASGRGGAGFWRDDGLALTQSPTGLLAAAWVWWAGRARGPATKRTESWIR